MEPMVFVDAFLLEQNLRRLFEASCLKSAFPVIKANAYGHDSRLVARIYSEKFTLQEVPFFCVARSSEADVLLKENFPQKILILSAIDWNWHLENQHLENVSWVLSSPEDLAEWIEKGVGVSSLKNVHLKINTGMNRLGFSREELLGSIKILKKAVSLGLVIEGVMTHFWNSDGATSRETESQMKVFSELLNELKKQELVQASTWIHTNNSAAIKFELQGFEGFQNAFRPGIHLWGYGVDQNYFDKDKISKTIKPVLSFGAPVRKIIKIQPGEGLSYGWRYKNKTTDVLSFAVVSMGYADGIPRSLSCREDETSKGFLWIEGKLCPIVSTVTMDMVMVKLDRSIVNKIKVNQTFAYWIHHQKQNAYEISKQLSTITYEALCMISYRVARKSINGQGELP